MKLACSTFSILRGSRHWLPLATLVQTDGAFYPSRVSKTAVFFPVSKDSYTAMYTDHKDSTESEWRSVFDGVQKQAPLLCLENDNLGVISSLLLRKPPKQPYRDYYWGILDSVLEKEFVAMRWIPRRFNKAHSLFRSSSS